jgi:hypothetical protein
MEMYDISVRLLKDKVTLNDNQFDEKWKDFSKMYPTLYEMLINDENMDMSILKFMCEKLSTNGNTYDCQKEVGNKLAEKYVFKTIEKPTKKQMEEADKKSKKKFDSL